MWMVRDTTFPRPLKRREGGLHSSCTGMRRGITVPLFNPQPKTLHPEALKFPPSATDVPIPDTGDSTPTWRRHCYSGRPRASTKHPHEQNSAHGSKMLCSAMHLRRPAAHESRATLWKVERTTFRIFPVVLVSRLVHMLEGQNAETPTLLPSPDTAENDLLFNVGL